MTIGTVCSRDVCTSMRGAALAGAAERMTKRHIGSVVVVEESDSGRLRPVGILTDRDVVCGQLSPPRDMFCMSVEDVMSTDVLTLKENCGIPEAVARMSERSVRRAPVVDAKGNLVGIVSIDDLLPRLAGELVALAELIRTQSGHER